MTDNEKRFIKGIFSGDSSGHDYYHTIRVYKLAINYGYIEGVMALDGEEQDAYILGVNERVDKFTGKIMAIVHRKDDIEEKWVVVPDGMMFSKDEIRQQIYFQEQYFDSEIVM